MATSAAAATLGYVSRRAAASVLALVALAAVVAGCKRKPQPEPGPVVVATSTPEVVVPPEVPGSETQISFQRFDLLPVPFARYLAAASAEARRRWDAEASLRQVEATFNRNTGQLSYVLRFITERRRVSGNPAALDVYYGYDTPVIELAGSRRHQPAPSLSTTTVAIRCVTDGACNLTDYSGRPPISTPLIRLSFPEAYAIIAPQLGPVASTTGPATYALTVEADRPVWAFDAWRVDAETGSTTKLSL